MKNTRNINTERIDTENTHKNPKSSILAMIALTLLGKPTEAKASNHRNQNTNPTELNDNRLERTKEQMTIDYIKKNFIINGKAVEQLNSNITADENNTYIVEYDDTLNGKTYRYKLIITAKYENNNIKIYVDSLCYYYKEKGVRNIIINKENIDDDNTIENGYKRHDILINGNEKTITITTKENKFKTEKFIMDIINKHEITNKTEILTFEELENTQLTGLNNIKAGKEINKKSGGYSKDLFFGENKYCKVGEIFFNENGEYDKEKTQKAQNDFKILGININYSISLDKSGNISINIDQNSINQLKEKVIHDRNLIINLLNNTHIGSNTDFPGFNKKEKDNYRGIDSKLINIDLETNSYTFEYDNQKKIKIIIDGENIFFTDQNHEKLEQCIVNTKSGYYKMKIEGGNLHIVKIRDKNNIENQNKDIPNLKGDQNIISSLNKALTMYENGELYFYDKDGTLITKIPCTKNEDGEYELSKDFSTKIEIDKLYEYFNKSTNGINLLAKKAGISNIDILNIFETLLKNKGIDLDNYKCIKINHNGKLQYYKISNKFNIGEDEKLYRDAKECLKTIKEKLEFINKINNCKILCKVGNSLQNLENYIGGESGIGKAAITRESANKLLSGETNEVEAVLSRGNGNSETISYSIQRNIIKAILNGESTITIGQQKYKITIDNENGNIILIAIEEKN